MIDDKDIRGFHQEGYEFLSNMYSLPEPIIYNDVEYWTSENLYVAFKTHDRVERFKISLMTPKESKAYGRALKLREDWDAVKLPGMRYILERKFSIPELRDKLLSTGNSYIEETNWWHDTFWGVCKGEGENHLGELLMEIRGEIKDAK